MAILMPEGKQSFTNDAGIPLSAGRLYTYAAGTTTLKTTWSDAAQSAPNTNPIILNARGEASVFWNGSYKVELRTAADAVIWTVDDVTAVNDVVSAATLAASGGSALVGFIQAGTGAIARTAQSKMREPISADDFIPVNLLTAIRNYTSAVDLSTYITNAVTAAGTAGKVIFGPGQYTFNAVIPNRVTFVGVSMQGTIFKPFSTATPCIMHTDVGPQRQFQFTEHRNFSIVGPGSGTSGQAGEGIRFGAMAYSTGQQFCNAIDCSFVGVYGLDKGFVKPWGNIGGNFRRCNAQFNNYDFHFKSYDGGGVPANVMHAGNCYIYPGECNSSLLAHVYIDSPLLGTGQFVYDGGIPQSHRGFVFFIKAWNNVGTLPSIDIRSGWNEANANEFPGATPGATVTIDGTPYQVRYLYAKDTTLINFRDTPLGTMQLVNSVVRTYGCNIDFCASAGNSIDSTSSLEHNEARTDSVITRNMVRSWVLSTRKAGGMASTVRMPHRNGTSKTWPAVYKNDATAPIAYVGTSAGNTTSVTTDGTTFGTSQDLVVGGASTFLIGGGFSVAADRYVIALLSAKCVSGNGVNVIISGSAQLGQYNAWTDTTDWQTMVVFTDTIGQAARTGMDFYFSPVSGASTIRIGGLAVLEFTNKNHADAFLASGIFPV